MILKTSISKILIKRESISNKTLALKIWINLDQIANFSLKCNKTSCYSQKMEKKTLRNNITKERCKKKIN